MKNNKILVVGELIIDEHFFCNKVGVSLETPTTPKVMLRHSNQFLGGAGMVYAGLESINKLNALLTVVGKDFNKSLINRYKNIFFIKHIGASIKKQRYWVDNNKVLQINYGNEKKISNIKGIQSKIILKIHKIKKNFNSLIISDYRSGLFDKKFLIKILEICKNNNMTIYADQQLSDHKSSLEIFKDFDYLVINENELNKSLKKNIAKKKSIQRNTKLLQKKLNIPNLIIKRGSKGSMALMNNKFFYSKPFKKNDDIIDTAGAGDYYLSMFASTEGMDIMDRLKFSNIWSYLKIIQHDSNIPSYKSFLKTINR